MVPVAGLKFLTHLMLCKNCAMILGKGVLYKFKILVEHVYKYKLIWNGLLIKIGIGFQSKKQNYLL